MNLKHDSVIMLPLYNIVVLTALSINQIPTISNRSILIGFQLRQIRILRKIFELLKVKKPEMQNKGDKF